MANLEEQLARGGPGQVRLTGAGELIIAPLAAAALVVGKLCSSKRQQNALTAAIKEYGALRRTVYAARYLADETCRRRIARQLSKGENRHALRRSLAEYHGLAVAALRRAGRYIDAAVLAHIWPTRRESVHFYGTHSVDAGGELARLDAGGYRPLRAVTATEQVERAGQAEIRLHRHEHILAVKWPA